MTGVRLAIFLLTYALIAVQQFPGLRLNRPGAALVGAVAMIVLGGLPLPDAYAAIDGDVLVFLLGMLLLTGYLELGGFFEWAAARIVERVRSPRALLAAIVVTSGIFSALFINDTICLVFTPLVILILRPLRVRALPYLLAIALASNVGSVMTITGNPQNMLIGISSGIGFARFAAMLALPALGGLAIVLAVLLVAFRSEMQGLMTMTRDAIEVPFDRVLVVKALVVFAGALAGWLAGASLPLVAIAAGAVMVLIAGRDPARAFARVEWSLLLFFAALFVVMRGVRDLPLFTDLTTRAAGGMHGTAAHQVMVASATMVALSNLVSNVPAVLLWLHLVPHLPRAELLWLVIAMSSTLAGNLTLLGSMANLIVAERAAARGERIGFVDYVRVGIPVTLLTLGWGLIALRLVWRPR